MTVTTIVRAVKNGYIVKTICGRNEEEMVFFDATKAINYALEKLPKDLEKE